MHDRWRKPVLADRNHRMQVVRAGAQVASKRRKQGIHA
jgi:hypothetical protein